MMDDSLAPLQAALESTAGLPYDQARSMPGAFYTDPRLLALEREQLFMRECRTLLPRVGEGSFLRVRVLIFTPARLHWSR